MNNKDDIISVILRKNPFLTLHQAVKEALYNDIISCNLMPEQHLKEAEFANVYGVSRTTIRRAFESLLYEGWLVPNGKLGVKVANMCKKDYLYLIEMRMILDASACQLSARRRTYKDLKYMKQFLDMGSDTSDLNTFYKADESFHMAIYKSTKNNYFIKIYEIMGINLARTKMYFALKDDVMETHTKQRIINEHTSIFNAIKSSNEQVAYNIGKNHAKILPDCLYKENSKNDDGYNLNSMYIDI